MPVAKKIKSYQEMGSLIRKLFEEGTNLLNDGSGKPVFDFTLGNPELEPPEQFRAILGKIAGTKERGTHKYMSNQGYEQTRTAVAADLRNDHEIAFDSKNVVMTSGAAAAVNVALKAILDPGEEVIVNAPYFVEYRFYIEKWLLLRLMKISTYHQMPFRKQSL